MYAKEKKEKFLGYANEIKNLGYKVFVTTREMSNYGWIVNDKDEIGYFQLGDYGFGIKFSCIHHPMNEYGSGFSVHDDSNDYDTEFSRESVDRVFAKYPGWMLSRPHWEQKLLGSIKKYSAKEYLENYWDKANIVEI